MRALNRFRPIAQMLLPLAVVTLAINVALHGLASTRILGWIPKAVSGTGYLEDNRLRVASAVHEFQEGRVSADTHLGAIVGISNVREGIDVRVISETAGASWRVLGLGGAGLGIADVAPHADVLLESALRPDVVVIGLGLHQLVDTKPKPGTINIGFLDYVRRGDLRNAATAGRSWLWFYDRRQDVSLATDAAELDSRDRLFRAFGVSLPQTSDAPHSPWRDMLKSDWPDHFSSNTLHEEEQFFEDLGVFDLRTYQTSPKATATLVRLVSEFRHGGATVVLVLMPEQSTLGRRIPADALTYLQRPLQEHFSGDLPPVLDFRRTIGDDGFVDLAHLNRNGSARFSRVLAGELRKLWPTSRSLMAGAVTRPVPNQSAGLR